VRGSCSSCRGVPVASARALLAALLVVVGLAGCSSKDDAGDAPPHTSESAAPAWNPCTGLDGAAISRLFATPYTVRSGTAAAPVCTFSPQTDGDPAFNVNYQLIVGTLGDLLDTFGNQRKDGRTTVLAPTVDGADDARVIVDTSGRTLVLTGFVRTGPLVQVVNLLDPTPYERGRLVAHVESLLAVLAANADSSGLTG
jgi:hypothetical protein